MVSFWPQWRLEFGGSWDKIWDLVALVMMICTCLMMLMLILLVIGHCLWKHPPWFSVISSFVILWRVQRILMKQCIASLYSWKISAAGANGVLCTCVTWYHIMHLLYIPYKLMCCLHIWMNCTAVTCKSLRCHTQHPWWWELTVVCCIFW